MFVAEVSPEEVSEEVAAAEVVSRVSAPSEALVAAVVVRSKGSTALAVVEEESSENSTTFPCFSMCLR